MPRVLCFVALAFCCKQGLKSLELVRGPGELEFRRGERTVSGVEVCFLSLELCRMVPTLASQPDL